MPSGTLELVNENAILAHGKAIYQLGSDLPPPVHAGARVTFHWSVELRLSKGKYRFSVQLAEATS